MFLRDSPWHLVVQERRPRGTERGVRFRHNSFRLEVSDKLVLRVVQVQLQLIEIELPYQAPSPRGSGHTWSTAGITFAVFKIFSIIISEQFDTPMVLTLPKSSR